MSTKRLIKEKKIENESIQVKVGTLNKENVGSYYLKYRVFISPNNIKQLYSKDIHNIKRKFRYDSSDILTRNNVSLENSILLFDISEINVKLNKKSLLTVEYVIKHSDDETKDFSLLTPKIKTMSSEIEDSLLNSILYYDFSPYKTKTAQ